MRVVAGSAGGRRLGPVPPGTRPVSDRAREGLFSSLGELVVDAAVLDVYAGTGALGIEALSRGAGHATFVDSAYGAITAIKDNLDRTDLRRRATVIRQKVDRFVSETPDDPGERYDLILADPPYDEDVETVNALVDGLISRLAAPGATVALTRPNRSSTFVIPVNWQVARRLRYGDTLILLLREV